MCIFHYDGNKHYYKDNVNHRDGDLPSFTTPRGDKVYRKNGKFHRTFGPAVLVVGGKNQYWLNDKRYHDITNDKEWLKYQKLIAFE